MRTREWMSVCSSAHVWPSEVTLECLSWVLSSFSSVLLCFDRTGLWLTRLLVWEAQGPAPCSASSCCHDEHALLRSAFVLSITQGKCFSDWAISPRLPFVFHKIKFSVQKRKIDLILLLRKVLSLIWGFQKDVRTGEMTRWLRGPQFCSQHL